MPTHGAASAPVRFNQPFLVLVEGSDDQAFVAALVKYLELDQFQIHDMGGNSNWPSKLSAIALDDGFKANVLALGLVRDADQNPTGTWESCKSAIANSKMTPPSRPGELSAGDVCLSSFSQDRMACVNSYFACLDTQRAGGRARPKKAYVQTYLAGLIPPVRDIRIATERDILDFSHSTFDELKGFLRHLHSVTNLSEAKGFFRWCAALVSLTARTARRGGPWAGSGYSTGRRARRLRARSAMLVMTASAWAWVMFSRLPGWFA
jgi:hypothetical protein